MEQQWGMDDLCLARAYDQVMSGAIKARSVSACVWNPTAGCISSLEINPPLKRKSFSQNKTPHHRQQFREKNMHPNTGDQTKGGCTSKTTLLPWVLGVLLQFICSAPSCPLKAELQPLGSSVMSSKSLKWVTRTERENLIKAWRKRTDLLAGRQQKAGEGTHRLCSSMEAQKDTDCWCPLPELQGPNCAPQNPVMGCS